MATYKETVIRWGTDCLLFLVIWSAFWGAFGSLCAPPNGLLYAFIVLYVLAYIFGEIAMALRIPKLFGMIIAGVVLANTTNISYDPIFSSIVRNIALAIILLRGGLGLDPYIIKKMSGVCFRLTFVPLIAESVTMGILGHYALGLPLIWSFMLGFILAAACAAIIVPTMLNFQEAGLGVAKGIPSIVIAASSMDDVFAISAFSVMLGFAFASDQSLSVWAFLKGPLEAVLGIGAGALYGLLLWLLPDKSAPNMNLSRTGLVLTGGLAFVFISDSLNFSGAGPLGALTLAFVAGIKLRPRAQDEQIEEHLKICWSLAEPFLFSLIGIEVLFANIELSSIVMVLVCLAITIVIRFASTFACLYGAELNMREKAFISIAWLSKAAVQAACGPIALDLAKSRGGNQDDIKYATLVLTVCFFTILVSTPIGIFGMATTSSRFLTPKETTSSQCAHGENDENYGATTQTIPNA